MYRTHNCGELCKKDIGKEVVLSGWIQKKRNLGSLCFIDIRDYFGITQLIFSKNLIEKFFLGKEFLIKIQGKVVERISKNNNIPTGEIEISVSQIEILNSSLPTPFTIENQTDGNEEIRMKYRYLDIRRNPIKNNLIIRHNLALEIRNFLSQNGFLEIETPVLINYTPEGARSFVVPSRTHVGKFYALAQSPQLFKQLLMIGGIDKYFQIVKCFRDEDARSDRQIEFTQIDCEMSFVEVDDVLIFFENFIKHLFRRIKNIQLESFPCISYSDAMKMYGTDSPDIRFGMPFIELNNLVQKKNISFLKEQELIIGIKVPKCHKNHDQMNSLFKKIENPNIFWIQYLSNKTLLSSNPDFFSEEIITIFINHFQAVPGDLLFISYGKRKNTRKTLGKVRLEIANHLNLKNSKIFKPLWVTDLPLLEWDERSKRYKSVHHPFTSPKKEDIHLLEKYPENIRSQSYDLIINGIEIGSGSIRIHNQNIQNLIFKHLGLSAKEIESEFGFFIKSFEYGTPPHGGIAFGLDRLINLLEGNDDIKNFIAFPKSNYGEDLMTKAPSFLKKEKLKELHLR
ncbi:aspartate-tRNA ligase [Blattabacterium sp. (Blattella germanica) str. Bge]|uniref:aspartate--tRNA ligase n=1 Tax=Blattabacterium sp. (Blattella germanica) TaxID=624186 RepID=UPI0001BB6295|nr:aspartate--tRNA ligase [Blattabacterium sp. (Blattella germanica)]ACY40048.1 aspartate-tRNA ligase [Blattabacterium sp. (Blattella germanica) str. Bge]